MVIESRLKRETRRVIGRALTQADEHGTDAGAVMGDPLSVPEQPWGEDVPGYGRVPDYPAPVAEPMPRLAPRTQWIKVPHELYGYLELGFFHSDEFCPCIALRVRDEDDTTRVSEITGPPEYFMALAQAIIDLCHSVPCITHEATRSHPRVA